MNREEYRYELRLIDDTGGNVTYSFNGFVDLEELQINLHRFLLACDWSEDQMKQLFKEKYYE